MKRCIFFCLCFITVHAVAQQLYEMPQGVNSRVSSFENPNGSKGNGGKTNRQAKGNAFEFVQPGETKTLLDIQASGIIQRIWMTIDQDPVKLRSLRLQMFWDNDKKPAVDVPMGDFFCYNLGKPVIFHSELFSTGEGRSFNCYVPMPFRKAAKILLINEGKVPVKLFYDVDFILKNVDRSALYFHAFWSGEDSKHLGDDRIILPKVNGSGRFLGMSVGLQTDSSYEKSWWGEGEVKMFLDGDSLYPTIAGTGAEDYAGTAWGMGKFTEPYQGCTIADETTGLFSFYRWHIKDEIWFQKNIEVRLQQIGGWGKDDVAKLINKGVKLKPITVDGPAGFIRLLDMPSPPEITDPKFPDGWTNFFRIDHYSTTAYFYLNQTSAAIPPLATVSARLKNLPR